jgi:hypothetical protein
MHNAAGSSPHRALARNRTDKILHAAEENRAVVHLICEARDEGS